LQFAGAHLATSLVSFNLGVELGQIAVLAVAIPSLGLLFSRVVAERMGTIILSAFVAHTAWHWLLDRGALLMQYRVELPTFDAALLATVLRGTLVCVAAAGIAWGVHALARHWRSAPALELENTPPMPNE
jgi:HupE/UreJ protein